MRGFAVLLVVALVLMVETEARRRGKFQRDRGRRPRGRNMWDQLLHSMRTSRIGGRHSFSLGGDPFGFDLDFGWNFGHRQRPWYEGPNVCRNEKTDNDTSDDSTITHNYKTVSQVCEEGEAAYRCTTTVQTSEGTMTKMEILECCHGFARKPEDFGCPQEFRLVPLPELAERLELKDLLRAFTTAGLDEELTRGNFTLFAPRDGSFSVDSGVLSLGPGFSLQDETNAVVVSEPLLTKLESELQAVLLGHLLPEPRRASSFRDEEVLETGSPYDATVRINFYSRPEKLTTANCVPVTSTDNIASNGVIHIVDKVLPTVTSSLTELIQRDNDLSILKTALAKAGLVSKLQQEGQYTLLAPTNAAFQKVDRDLLDRLLNGDPECLQKVLKQHLLPHVICSAVLEGRAKSRNVLGNYVNLTRTDDKKLFADDAQIVRTDVMATNGVMHIIDAVLVPDDALDVVSAAEKKGLTELVSQVRASGWTSLQHAQNITVFAPINEAFQEVPPDDARLMASDPELLQSVLAYHVVPEEKMARQLANNMVLDTLNAQGKLRVNEYYSFPFGHRRVLTVQCAPVLVRDAAACNGLFHLVDRVLLPPRGNVVDVLAADPEYSTLVRLVKVAGLADALQVDGPLTVFAPNNQAFDQLGKEELRKLEENPDKLADILKLHVMQDHLCCAGIFHSPWWHRQRGTSIGGHSFYLSRDRNGNPHVGDAFIRTCDTMATNGVVHRIDEVLMPRPAPWYMFP